MFICYRTILEKRDTSIAPSSHLKRPVPRQVCKPLPEGLLQSWGMDNFGATVPSDTVDDVVDSGLRYYKDSRHHCFFSLLTSQLTKTRTRISATYPCCLSWFRRFNNTPNGSLFRQKSVRSCPLKKLYNITTPRSSLRCGLIGYFFGKKYRHGLVCISCCCFICLHPSYFFYLNFKTSSPSPLWP